MNGPAWLAAFVFISAAHADEPPRAWTLRDGRTFDASLAAADGLRATLAKDGKKSTLPVASLAPADAALVRAWRAASFHHPLISPDALAPWPAFSVTENFDARATGEDAGVFSYESAHFAVTSDLKLPVATVRELAGVFEGTRELLIALPLGLHAGGEREKYAVSMHASPLAYSAAGGGGGSGGFFDSRRRRLLILLPNIGIEQRPAGLRLDFQRNLFVLKHEVTHQLLARWHGQWPMWLSEGFCEFTAALPYTQGRYTLGNPSAAIRDYVLKWRKTKDDRTLRLVPPARLMAMESADWRGAVEAQQAYDLYNSAALLTWYFLQQDGGRPFAAYVDALRRRAPNAEHALLGGKSRESLTVEILAMAKRMGIECKLAD